MNKRNYLYPLFVCIMLIIAYLSKYIDILLSIALFFFIGVFLIIKHRKKDNLGLILGVLLILPILLPISFLIFLIFIAELFYFIGITG
jgi:hypothetical protein